MYLLLLMNLLYGVLLAAESGLNESCSLPLYLYSEPRVARLLHELQCGTYSHVV